MSYKFHKCGHAAAKFRDEGRKPYLNGNFLDALLSFNKSLCSASPGSQEMAFAYNNRSVIYMDAKRYEKCLENIELARINGYPTDKMAKLNEHEEKCKKLMEESKYDAANDPWSFFKLSYPPNEKIPFIVNCLELGESEKYGRHILTTSNLKPGDIIAIEEPFFKYIDKKAYLVRCANCLKANDLSLIPCANCTTTMYCSNDCKTEHEKLHLYDCGVLDVDFDVLCSQALESSISIAGSVDELQGLLIDPTRRTVFDFDLSNPKDPSYKKNLLIAVNSLAKLPEHVNDNSVIKKILEFKPFRSRAVTGDNREFLEKFLSNQCRILPNQYCLSHLTRKVFSPEIIWTFHEIIGRGLCAFGPLFNHSCDPNVVYATVDNKIAFVVVKPIAAGDQLFLNYLSNSFEFTREERRVKLNACNFTCDCDACVADYPPMMQLPRKNETFEKPRITIMTVRAAVDEFKKCCRYIEDNIKCHPSYETTTTISQLVDLMLQISTVSFDKMGFEQF